MIHQRNLFCPKRKIQSPALNQNEINKGLFAIREVDILETGANCAVFHLTENCSEKRGF